MAYWPNPNCDKTLPIFKSKKAKAKSPKLSGDIILTNIICETTPTLRLKNIEKYELVKEITVLLRN